MIISPFSLNLSDLHVINLPYGDYYTLPLGGSCYRRLSEVILLQAVASNVLPVGYIGHPIDIIDLPKPMLFYNKYNNNDFPSSEQSFLFCIVTILCT